MTEFLECDCSESVGCAVCCGGQKMKAIYFTEEELQQLCMVIGIANGFLSQRDGKIPDVFISLMDNILLQVDPSGYTYGAKKEVVLERLRARGIDWL